MNKIDRVYEMLHIVANTVIKKNIVTKEEGLIIREGINDIISKLEENEDKYDEGEV